MNRLQCELCGSVDIIKTGENVFQCQYCGCKYTLEQAKALIVTGEVKTKATDFEIVGGVLKKYNGEAIDIDVPDGVVKIGEEAFKSLSIRSVRLPDSVTEIERAAFYGCTDLKSVKMSIRVRKIGYLAFARCTSLNSIFLPSCVTEIEKDAFINCESLTELDLKNAKNFFNEIQLTDCKSLRSFIVPNGTEKVNFINCVSIVKIVLPETVNEINCYGCVSLKQINLPKNKPRDLCFSGCKSLVGLFIPDEWMNDTLIDGEWESYKNAFRRWGCQWQSFSYPEDRWKKAGKCARCGGEFTGVFKKVCTKCHFEKNY